MGPFHRHPGPLFALRSTYGTQRQWRMPLGGGLRGAGALGRLSVSGFPLFHTARGRRRCRSVVRPWSLVVPTGGRLPTSQAGNDILVVLAVNREGAWA